jgi:hypothetical protein
MLIEIQETHPPGAGKKVATVIAKGGDKFEIWPEKLAGLHVGARYDVDVDEREYNGRTIRKITKARPAATTTINGNGAAAVATAPCAGEPQFVATILAALITAGEVKGDKRALWDATKMLRLLYQHSFGGGTP